MSGLRSTASGRPLVTILQHRLLHYRMDFFERLKAWCDERNIELHLVHGQAAPAEKVRDDEGHLAWADQVENRYWHVGGRDILWQPLPAALRRSDLLVLMQENRILSNYPYLLGLKPAGMKLGYWGHGLNFQSRAPGGLRERWKRRLISRVDWWFAYTSMTVDVLRAQGYPGDRISCLNNAVDTASFTAQVVATPRERQQALRDELGIAADAPVGIFCGSLYPDKRLELMTAAGDLVRETVPDFHVVVIGDGPSAGALRDAARSRPWMHLVGTRRGADKAAFFSLARVMLNPGLLGLHILDSFSIGLPLVSTVDAPHSPEVAYLQNGVNGELVANDPRAYADAIVKMLSDAVYWQRLSDGARDAGSLYSVDNMVAAFGSGIAQCLARPAWL